MPELQLSAGQALFEVKSRLYEMSWLAAKEAEAA